MFGRKHTPESLAKMRAVKKATAKRGPENPRWKGGVFVSCRGYRMVTIPGSHRAVPEHRLIMARHLGRPLTRAEVVHHRNGVKTDNRLRNLELSDHATHKREHVAIVRELRRLRRENEALKSALRKCRKAG